MKSVEALVGGIENNRLRIIAPAPERVIAPLGPAIGTPIEVRPIPGTHIPYNPVPERQEPPVRKPPDHKPPDVER